MQEGEESLTAVITVPLIIFVAEFSYWFLHVFVVKNVIKDEALKTASYAAALTFNDCLATYFYVRNDIYYIFPACLGAAAGSLLAVKCNKKHQKNLKTGENRRK